MSIRNKPITAAEYERRALGLTQAALAAELGWPQPKLSAFERGLRPDPADVALWRATLDRLARKASR